MENAFTKLQTVLDIANTPANATNAYETWVAAGVYYPDEGSGRIDNDRSQSFLVMTHDNVYLARLRLGDARPRESSATKANVTVLSGDIDQTARRPTTPSTPAWTARPANITAATVIDGFTVTGGNASEYNQPSGYGGGSTVRAAAAATPAA